MSLCCTCLMIINAYICHCQHISPPSSQHRLDLELPHICDKFGLIPNDPGQVRFAVALENFEQIKAIIKALVRDLLPITRRQIRRGDDLEGHSNHVFRLKKAWRRPPKGGPNMGQKLLVLWLVLSPSPEGCVHPPLSAF